MIKILRSDTDKTIVLNSETNFGTDLGWEESFQEFEHETLKEIINPAENFETVRYIHSGYTGQLGVYQHDIWNEFYFVNFSGGTDGGLNYELIGLTPEENFKLLRSDNTSFFRLEFYKVPDDENPNSGNRKLVFTKNLPITMGERVYYTPILKNVYVPVFVGSNFRNKENMFLYWFEDNSTLEGTTLSGNTFYLSAKFYNTLDGTSMSFMNKSKNISEEIDETQDMYRRVDIERESYSYVVYTGITTDHRGGESSISTPLKWYGTSESNSTLNPYIEPTPSITPSVSITPSITPSVSITPSITITPTPSISPPVINEDIEITYPIAYTEDAVYGVDLSDWWLGYETTDSGTPLWLQLKDLPQTPIPPESPTQTGRLCAVANTVGWAHVWEEPFPSYDQMPEEIVSYVETGTECTLPVTPTPTPTVTPPGPYGNGTCVAITYTAGTDGGGGVIVENWWVKYDTSTKTGEVDNWEFYLPQQVHQA